MKQLVQGINLRMAREILVKINRVLGRLEDREWATGILAMEPPIASLGGSIR